MKVSKRIVWLAVIVALCLVAVVFTGQLLRDRKRDTIYFPDMDYRDLPNYIVQLPNVSEPLNGENIVSRDGFEGSIAYSCTVSSAEEIKAYFAKTFWNAYDGTHYTFPNDSYEIFVHTAQYMPIVRAWGHNWMHYDGNLYEQINGKDAGEDRPNFRNYFKFTIRKEDTKYTFTVFCNTDDPEKVLAEAIQHLNNVIYSSKK